MHFSLKKLLNYEGNRYQLARACMEYAKRVRHVSPQEYYETGEKEALISLRHILEGDIKHTSDAFEIEIYEDEAEVIISQREMEIQRQLEKEENKAKKELESLEQEEIGTSEDVSSEIKIAKKMSQTPSVATSKEVDENDDNKEELASQNATPES